MRLDLDGDHAAVGGTPRLGLSRAPSPLCMLPANDAGLRTVHDDDRFLLQDALLRHKLATCSGITP